MRRQAIVGAAHVTGAGPHAPSLRRAVNEPHATLTTASHRFITTISPLTSLTPNQKPHKGNTQHVGLPPRPKRDAARAAAQARQP